jgi:prolyl-tRNA synthetase
VAAGVYASLPLLDSVVTNVVRVIDEELKAIGCQRTTMPALTPASLWQRTNRWETAGDELWRVKDRRQVEFCLGPTHEEVFGALVGDALKADAVALPLRLYQITSKYVWCCVLYFIIQPVGLLLLSDFAMKFDRDSV